MYRITPFHDLDYLCDQSDAIFVHSSTSSHFEVVRHLLMRGKDVYVDKPLAETMEQAEMLVDLSQKYNRKLMVGFNRRFAPMYVKAKEACDDIAWVRIDKYRKNKINHGFYQDTLLDSYIHLIDLARWISNGQISLKNGHIQKTENDHLVYSHHSFQGKNGMQVLTGFHRSAGTGLELLEIINMGKIIRVKNLHTYEIEENGELKMTETGAWDSILKEKGFEGAVHHFINSILGDTPPIVDGLEGLESQKLVMDIIEQSL
jgi:virulence factor